MKNYDIEIKSTDNISINHTYNNHTNKSKYLDKDKKDQIISLLTNIVENFKNKINYKNENLENLIEKIKTHNYSEINSFKSEDYINLQERLNNIGINEIVLKKKYENLNYDIFKYLNCRDLISLGMTSNKLKEITSNVEYWKRIYFKDYNYLLFLDDRDKCEIIENIKNEKDTKEENNSIMQKYNKIEYKNKYIELQKINKSWETERPVVTTISTQEPVTCLHLDTKSNELIYSASDGSASLFRLYSYRKIASNEEIYMQHHKQTKICDKISNFHGHGGSIWCIDRNEEILFTGSYDKTIKLWSTRTGENLSTIRAHENWVSSIHYDKLYEMLLSCSWDSTIKLWNIKTLQNIKTFNQENGNYIYCVRSNLAQDEIISGNEMKTINIWNINNPSPISTFIGHTERINSIKVKDDLILSGSEDKHARLWDKRTGNCEILFTGHQKGITQIEFDHLNYRVFTASIDKTVKIWDIRKNSELRTLIGHSEAVTSLAFDQTKLISGSRDNSIRIWNFFN